MRIGIGHHPLLAVIGECCFSKLREMWIREANWFVQSHTTLKKNKVLLFEL